MNGEPFPCDRYLTCHMLGTREESHWAVIERERRLEEQNGGWRRTNTKLESLTPIFL